jgi:RNA polymerase sigma factor (sigma-70 family)
MAGTGENVPGGGGLGGELVVERFQQLLHEAQEGRGEAWETIYDELAPALLGYLRAQGAVEPEDLLGEIFLQMVRDLAGFEGGEAQFRAWAFTVAHHRLVDERRYRARRPVEPLPPEALLESAAPDETDEGSAVADARVGHALRRLPAQQRNVILLRVLGDLSIAEVARVLGKTPGAVKAAQTRALASLKRQMTKLTVTL